MKTVLLVCNNSNCVSAVSIIISKHSSSFSRLRTAQKALFFIRENKPTVIIFDEFQSDIEPFEFFKLVQKISEKLSLIIINSKLTQNNVLMYHIAGKTYIPGPGEKINSNLEYVINRINRVEKLLNTGILKFKQELITCKSESYS